MTVIVEWTVGHATAIYGNAVALCCLTGGTIIRSEGFARMAQVQNGADALSGKDDVRKRFGIMARELFRMFKYVERGQLDDERAARDAISAVYDTMHKRVARADNSALMKRINDIVSESIEVTAGAKDDSKRFDLSSIDFERLRMEFARRQQQNLILRDLQTLLEERLAEMLAVNPTRIDFYERYQTIVEAYNQEQDRAAIEKTFADLMKLASDLDDETERWVREGFDNEDQLALFDLLKKDSLSKEDIKTLKASARELLDAIRRSIADMDNWREKESTRAAVQSAIRNVLWNSLPQSYSDTEMKTCRQKVYTFVMDHYPATRYAYS